MDNGITFESDSGERAVKEIAHEFASWPMDEQQLKHVSVLRGKFDELLSHICAVTPPQNGRYLSIVKTKLEEACMFTIKGIAKP